MWRTLAIVALLLACLGAWKKYGGSHKPGSLSSQTVYEGFWEVRMKLQAGSRDFEMVVVGDNPLVKECEAGLTHFELTKFCTAANHCTLQPLQCEHEVAPRYQHMLDQQPASLHYVHLSGDTPEGPRRAVVVGWGMTEDESAQLCKGLRGSMNAKDNSFKISCI